MSKQTILEQLKQPFFNPVRYSFIKSLMIILLYFGLRLIGNSFLLILGFVRRQTVISLLTFEELVSVQGEIQVEMFVLQILLLILLVLLVYLVGYKPSLFSEGRILESKIKTSFKIYLATWLSLILFDLLISFLIPNYSQPMNQQLIEVLVDQQNTIIMFVTLVVIAPISEEIIFRGLIMRGMFPKYPIIGFIVSTVFFALAHSPGNSIDFIVYFILSVGLTYVYWRTREIKYPIIIHMVQNFISFIVMVYV